MHVNGVAGMGCPQSYQCLILAKVLAGVVLLLFAWVAWANDSGDKTFNFVRTPYKGAEFQLAAIEIPLNQVLDKIQADTGVPIHYSVLPAGRVTATCVASTLQAILECLFNGKADVIFRFADRPASAKAVNKPEEIWVLGTDFGLANKQTATCVATGLPQLIATAPALTSVQALMTLKPEDVDKLLAAATANDPNERAEAIAKLGKTGEESNPAIHAALATALADKQAEVRVQAVNSLAQREGESASKALQDALQDDDVSVRLMVVSNAGNNTGLLQQALTDSDETVRLFAAKKLQPLLK
jgi:hypothetical protein